MLRVCCNSCFLAFQSDEDDYVECQCEHLSIFAAEGNSDNRTGYELYFRIVCFVCMVSGLLCEFVLCILGFIINPSLSPPGHLIERAGLFNLRKWGVMLLFQKTRRRSIKN